MRIFYVLIPPTSCAVPYEQPPCRLFCLKSDNSSSHNLQGKSTHPPHSQLWWPQPGVGDTSTCPSPAPPGSTFHPFPHVWTRSRDVVPTLAHNMLSQRTWGDAWGHPCSPLLHTMLPLSLGCPSHEGPSPAQVQLRSDQSLRFSGLCFQRLTAAKG